MAVATALYTPHTRTEAPLLILNIFCFEHGFFAFSFEIYYYISVHMRKGICILHIYNMLGGLRLGMEIQQTHYLNIINSIIHILQVLTSHSLSRWFHPFQNANKHGRAALMLDVNRIISTQYEASNNMNHMIFGF